AVYTFCSHMQRESSRRATGGWRPTNRGRRAGNGTVAGFSGAGRNRMTVSAPPVEAAEQLLYAKPKVGQLVGTLGRGIAADPVAVDDVNLAAIETRDDVRRHIAMRQAARAGNVTCRIGLARAGIDDDDLAESRLQI